MPVTKPRDYDSTVARIAGNIMSGFAAHPEAVQEWATIGETSIVQTCVRLARAIVAETKATEYQEPS